MLSKGVSVLEMGFGAGPGLKFGPYGWSKGIRFSLAPIPISAHVRPTDDGLLKIKSLSASDQTLIYGAGILSNMYLAMFMSIFYMVHKSNNWFEAIVYIVFIILSSIVLWFGRYIFCNFLIFPTGLWIAYEIFFSRGFSGAKDALGSGNVKPVSHIVSRIHNLEDLLFVSAAISFALGLLNAMPFLPLDGGRIVLVWIEKIENYLKETGSKQYNNFSRLKLLYSAFGVTFVLIIVVGPVLVDLWKGIMLLF